MTALQPSDITTFVAPLLADLSLRLLVHGNVTKEVCDFILAVRSRADDTLERSLAESHGRIRLLCQIARFDNSRLSSFTSPPPSHQHDLSTSRPFIRECQFLRLDILFPLLLRWKLSPNRQITIIRSNRLSTHLFRIKDESAIGIYCSERLYVA